MYPKLKKEGYDFADNKEYARNKEKLTQALSLREDSEIREKIANIERKEKALRRSQTIWIKLWHFWNKK